MGRLPKCTVILTSYNRTYELKECILSVLKQTLTDFEFFIIDDGSEEKTRKIINKFSLMDDRIKYLQTDYDGDRINSDLCRYSDNINTCIEKSSGEYITYLTDDDIFYPNHLSSLSKMLDEDPEKMIVFGQQHIEFKNENWITYKKASRNIITNPLQKASAIVDHNSILHKRSLLDEVGLWPTGKEHWASADAGFFDKITAAGHLFYPCSEHTSAHRWHKNSVQHKMGVYSL